MNSELRTQNHDNIFKPNYLRELCSKYDLTPSKKYGQNYLITDSVVKKMVESADVQKGDRVVEIGPGFGVLTFALLERGANITAFEIEKKLEGYWDDNKSDNLEIIWGNVLTKFESKKFNSYKVIANLPYQITSNVLRTVLEAENKPESVTVMVQKEVAERIVAKPGDMSVLAVSVQYYGEPKIVCKVVKGNFWPEPKVDSAVLTIALKHLSTGAREHGSTEALEHLSTRALKHGSTGALKHWSTGALKHLSTGAREHWSTRAQFDKEFFRVVRAGFANKRKQLWRNLAVGLNLDKDEVQSILKQVVGNEKVRAQELSVSQWEEIVNRLN